MWQLIIALGLRMSVVATLAFIFTRTRLSRKLIKRQLTWKDKVPLILIFGGMGVLGTYNGIQMEGGAIANSRVVGVMTGGLLGGPVVGIAAGLIAGIHRYFAGGFTALSCALATVVEGAVGGLVYRHVGLEKLNWQVALWAGFAAEIVQMIIILIVAKPFSMALELVKVIGIPMILVNSAGAALFIMIILSIFQDQEKAGAVQAQKSLEIAGKTLSHLRKGLNMESAAKVARIIYDNCDFKAVAITNQEQILAHIGAGGDHHRPGATNFTGATRKCLAGGQITLARSKKDINCQNSNCPLGSAVLVPLRRKEAILGTLKLYHVSEGSVNTIDLEFAKGLAHLFSTQLELAALEEQSRMLDSVKLKALQAQINPHFLFNALNTIVSLVRTKPETARELLIELGDFFRNNLKYGEDFVSLKQELQHVQSYLAIEVARFGEKIQVQYDMDESCFDRRFPALLLQPLVENAVKHGILPQKGGGKIIITAKEDDQEMQVSVEDNGVGMNSNTISTLFEKKCSSASGIGIGIGLTNVNERLKSIYGVDFALIIRSSPGEGTVMSFTIPFKTIREVETDVGTTGVTSGVGR
ncbi:sensor histidine kinase [Metallumcola ferriviriculae]|uniref:histidine kinase n=1 Tax=Metallumcola ferriviriculae TaxID=3039180 RepID=A0AAU0UIJ2_9FIRM|nr:sensor histidine kinase [Desulfitibacteraceae bacterium MK1]